MVGDFFLQILYTEVQIRTISPTNINSSLKYPSDIAQNTELTAIPALTPFSVLENFMNNKY